jgi:hypothetical protein
MGKEIVLTGVVVSGAVFGIDPNIHMLKCNDAMYFLINPPMDLSGYVSHLCSVGGIVTTYNGQIVISVTYIEEITK